MPALWRLRQEGWKLGAPQAHSEFETILTVHKALSQGNTITNIFIIFNIRITSLFCMWVYVPVGVLGYHTLTHGSQRTAGGSWFLCSPCRSQDQAQAVGPSYCLDKKTKLTNICVVINRSLLKILRTVSF